MYSQLDSQLDSQLYSQLHSQLDSQLDSQLYSQLYSQLDSVYEAFKIYDLIRERQQPTFVNVVGYCYSAASVILLAASAERRTASANSSFLIHSPFLCEQEPDQHLTIEKAESYTAEMKAMDNKLRALYLERTPADEVTISNLMKAETIFGANSAKNWGFISRINDYQNLFNMSKLKQVLFDAFGIQMKAMDNTLRALYLERTTDDEVKISNLMKAETIFGANSAKNWGFISS